MGKDPFHIVQGSTHVPSATNEDSLADLDAKEHLARSEIQTAQEQHAKANQEEHEARGPSSAKGSAEGDLVFNIVTEAAGIRVISAAAEIIGDRMGAQGQAAQKQPRSMDRDIQESTRRAPGMHAQKPEGQIYTNTPKAQNKPNIGGGDICARANIARMSLNDQEGDAIQSWGVPNKKLNSVAATKQLVFGKELANEQSLDGIKLAREHNASMRQRADMAAPGLGMAMGPSMRPTDIAKIAEDEAALNRWRNSSDGSWSGDGRGAA
jgi:hypothetical protein